MGANINLLSNEELINYLKGNLKLQMVGDFTSPNNRNIQLVLEDEVISEVSFDVLSQDDYEG